ncbi:MAG: regulatory iron-sulfur-containing complex subunit RicT [Bacteroidota bacterium]
MGCGTCATKTEDGAPAGCQSNGSCGTTGCNKLNVYDWLSDMILPDGHKPFDIFEVRFKGSRKEFYRNVNNIPLRVGDMVAVEGSPGHDIGEISMAGELVRFQMRKKNITEGSPEIKTLYRIARPVDLEKYNEVRNQEHETMHKSRTIALHLNLRMKLSDVEYQGDGKKATFFYTADERVDFRELIKKLAEEFRVRIEMRQIGMRQEASRLGGIGSCGRELCCSTWLTDFKIVSTSAARYQNLSLNPLKLAGQCGKLKCCLNYELDSYMDALKDIPDSRIRLETTKGYAVHRKTDIFKRIMWYAYTGETANGESEPSFGSADSWVPMSVDRVKEIVALNKSQQKPDDLGSLDLSVAKPEHDFDDVVGQDSLTRMDHAKKKKKKKKKPGQGGGSDVATAAVTSETKTVNEAKPANPNQQSQRKPNQPSQDRNRQENKNQQQGNRNPNQQGNRNPQQGNNNPQTNRNQQGNDNPPRGNQPVNPAPQKEQPENKPTPPASSVPPAPPNPNRAPRQSPPPSEN